MFRSRTLGWKRLLFLALVGTAFGAASLPESAQAQVGRGYSYRSPSSGYRYNSNYPRSYGSYNSYRTYSNYGNYGGRYGYNGPIYHAPSLHYDRVWHNEYSHYTPYQGWHSHGHYDYVPHYTPGHFDYHHGDHIDLNPHYHHGH